MQVGVTQRSSCHSFGLGECSWQSWEPCAPCGSPCIRFILGDLECSRACAHQSTLSGLVREGLQHQLCSHLETNGPREQVCSFFF